MHEVCISHIPGKIERIIIKSVCAAIDSYSEIVSIVRVYNKGIFIGTTKGGIPIAESEIVSTNATVKQILTFAVAPINSIGAYAAINRVITRPTEQAVCAVATID